MKLTAEEALELYDARKYISFPFYLFDHITKTYHDVLINHAQVKTFSHQFPLIQDYDKWFASSGGNNHANPYPYGLSGNYYSYTRYAVTLNSNGGSGGSTVPMSIYQKNSSAENKAFQEFIGVAASYPECYQYYIGELREKSKKLDLVIFIDLDTFIKYYRNNGFFTKQMLAIIQQYALNQYHIYQLPDCSEEKEFTDIGPHFRLKLYDYQAQSTNWMIRIENSDYQVAVPKSSFYKVADKMYIEVLQKGTDEFMSQFVYEHDHETTEVIRCRGGILADIMGNGKTVTTIALIYHNRPTMLPMLTSIIEREVYIPSRATLVICPVNIVTQWEEELIKCLGPQNGGLSVLKIATNSHMRKYTLAQLVNADVILTTYDWLEHTNHVGTGFIKKNKVTEFLARQKAQRIKFGNNYHAYNVETLLFLKYHRIIYDEFHEAIDSVQRTNTIVYIIKNCLRSQNAWGISGTPLLDNSKIQQNLPDLLKIMDTNNRIYSMDVISQHAIYNRFLRRNEKQYLPPLKHRVVRVKQTLKEKQLYDSSLSQDTETLLKLCCYHNINAMNLQNIDDVALEQNKLRHQQRGEIEAAIKDIDITTANLVTTLKSLNPNIKDVSELFYLIDANHPLHTHKLVQSIQQTPVLQLQVDVLRQYRKNEQKCDKMRDELGKLCQCIDYYEQTISALTNTGQFKCPITGELVGDGEVVITKYGHLFSKAAIETLFEYGDGKTITCPVTGNPLNRIDLTIVTNKKVAVAEAATANEHVFGSKITTMIDAIKALKKEEKVIIFAEWDSLLHTIGTALGANMIPHVYIKGNINIRDKAIRDFQKDPNIKAILLSSVFGASGVNLIEATHVFIAHPFNGNQGQQYEKQAIGRSYRTGQTKEVVVTFFITEKTIEEEIWSNGRSKLYSLQ